MTKAAALFQPFKLGSLELANRIVMAPMTRSFSPGGVPGEDVVAYYRRRAQNAVGLIITEGTTIDRAGASFDPNIPNFHAPDSLAGWKKVVDAVHCRRRKDCPPALACRSGAPSRHGPEPRCAV